MILAPFSLASRGRVSRRYDCKKRMTKNTADLRDEIIRGRSLLTILTISLPFPFRSRFLPFPFSLFFFRELFDSREFSAKFRRNFAEYSLTMAPGNSESTDVLTSAPENRSSPLVVLTLIVLVVLSRHGDERSLERLFPVTRPLVAITHRWFHLDAGSVFLLWTREKGCLSFSHLLSRFLSLSFLSFILALAR